MTGILPFLYPCPESPNSRVPAKQSNVAPQQGNKAARPMARLLSVSVFVKELHWKSSLGTRALSRGRVSVRRLFLPTDVSYSSTEGITVLPARAFLQWRISRLQAYL